MTHPEIVVVGSVNEDLVVPLEHHPGPGETVLGGDWWANPGGKGANQAVAAARLGRRVAFVGAVGNDDAGAALTEALVVDGIDISCVRRVDAPTGRAFITVDEAAENRIVVSPGANSRVGIADVDAALQAEMFTEETVVLLQLEIPVAAVAHSAAQPGRTVLNPAPAAVRPHNLLNLVDVVIPNKGELASLVGGTSATSMAAVTAQAQQLPTSTVVVTLGAEGVLVLQGDQATEVPAVPANAVDTTGAGDSFCGAFADAMVAGADAVEAARWAVRAAAVTVTRAGAQASLPTRAEVDAV